MKTVIALFISLLSICSYASNSNIAQLLNERENRMAEYRHLNDSVFTSKMLKSALLNEKLLSITALDSSFIITVNQEIATLNDSITKLNLKIAGLRMDNQRLEDRTINDLKMILILKIAVALFIVTILILTYFLISRKPKKNDNDDLLLSKMSDLERTNEGFLREIDRLKSKEQYLIEEHENGVRTQQNHYSLLSEKYNKLEIQYNELKDKASAESYSTEKFIPNTENSSELKEENEKLVNQVTSLKLQLDDARAKNQAILRKIDKLISDLSGVNSVS